MTPAASTFNPDATLPILQDIQRSFGMAPNLFRAYAQHPALPAANWSKVKGLLLNGVIGRRTKEIMAFLVSLDNGCAYCVAAHSAALIKFARKVNLHWCEVFNEDINALKQLGTSETAIIETIGIVELFGGFNRFARVMQVEVDF